MSHADVDYVAATRSGEVIEALADGATSVLAGGQSLVLDLTNGRARPRRVVDINRVAEFEVLAEADGMLRIGPLVRHRDFESDTVPGPLGAAGGSASEDGRRDRAMGGVQRWGDGRPAGVRPWAAAGKRRRVPGRPSGDLSGGPTGARLRCRAGTARRSARTPAARRWP